MFSATFEKTVMELSKKIMNNNPTIINIKPEFKTAEKIE